MLLETIMKKVKQYIMSLDHSNEVKCDASAWQNKPLHGQWPI